MKAIRRKPTVVVRRKQPEQPKVIRRKPEPKRDEFGDIIPPIPATPHGGYMPNPPSNCTGRVFEDRDGLRVVDGACCARCPIRETCGRREEWDQAWGEWTAYAKAWRIKKGFDKPKKV